MSIEAKQNPIAVATISTHALLSIFYCKYVLCDKWNAVIFRLKDAYHEDDIIATTNWFQSKVAFMVQPFELLMLADLGLVFFYI